MTDRYGVFGNPIAQSKSPQIHQQFAAQTQQDISYDKYCVEPGEFIHAANRFFEEGGKGLNITAPFKYDAFSYAHKLSERATLAQAVNTLALQEDGTLWGDTTDGTGLVSDIKDRLGWEIKGKDVLILGAGGAVRGVLYPLLKEAPSQLSIANRTVSKAECLVETFSAVGNIRARAFEDEPGRVYDIVVNGTSASLSGALPPLNKDAIGNKTVVYDMVYGKQPTPFMSWAKEAGAEAVSDGLGMLVGQAAESFQIWRKVAVDMVPVIKLLQAQL